MNKMEKVTYIVPIHQFATTKDYLAKAFTSLSKLDGAGKFEVLLVGNLEDVMDACLSSLGKIQLTKISLNFILSLGINTNKEPQEAVESYIRNNIFLPKDTKLKWKNTGLTKEELYDIIKMKSDIITFGKFVFAKDYADLSSSQLNLLVNKLLPALYNKCGYQKFLWKSKMKEIVDVGLYKGWNVANDI